MGYRGRTFFNRLSKTNENERRYKHYLFVFDIVAQKHNARYQCLDQVKRSILPEVEAQLQDRCALLMEYLGDDEESLTHSKRSENADPLYLAISQRVESVKQVG